MSLLKKLLYLICDLVGAARNTGYFLVHLVAFLSVLSLLVMAGLLLVAVVLFAVEQLSVWVLWAVLLPVFVWAWYLTIKQYKKENELSSKYQYDEED